MPDEPGCTVISTIGDLIDRGFEMHMTCPKCRLTRPVDLQALADKYGRDTTYIRPASPIRAKCRRCGSVTSEGIIIPR